MSDDGTRPDDRAFNRRERLADECEERAHEEAQSMVGAQRSLSALLRDLHDDELIELSVWLLDLCVRPGRSSARLVRDKVFAFAYRRALAAERRSAGLE